MKHAPDYTKGNAEAAGIILEHPELYGAGLVEWARRWQASHPVKQRRWEKPQAAAGQDGPQMKLELVANDAA